MIAGHQDTKSFADELLMAIDQNGRFPLPTCEDKDVLSEWLERQARSYFQLDCERGELVGRLLSDAAERCRLVESPGAAPLRVATALDRLAAMGIDLIDPVFTSRWQSELDDVRYAVTGTE